MKLYISISRFLIGWRGENWKNIISVFTRRLIFDRSLTLDFISFHIFFPWLGLYRIILALVYMSIAAFPMHDWLTVCTNSMSLGRPISKKYLQHILTKMRRCVFLFIRGRQMGGEAEVRMTTSISTLTRVTYEIC